MPYFPPRLLRLLRLLKVLRFLSEVFETPAAAFSVERAFAGASGLMSFSATWNTSSSLTPSAGICLA